MSKPKHGTGLLLPSRESLLWGDSDLALVVEAARRAEAERALAEALRLRRSAAAST